MKPGIFLAAGILAACGAVFASEEPADDGNRTLEVRRVVTSHPERQVAKRRHSPLAKPVNAFEMGGAAGDDPDVFYLPIPEVPDAAR